MDDDKFITYLKLFLRHSKIISQEIDDKIKDRAHPRWEELWNISDSMVDVEYLIEKYMEKTEEQG